MSVRILTDTSSEITQEEAKKYKIDVVPMYINFSHDVLKDGIDLSKDMFYERMLKDTPKTSQPSPSDFLPFFKDAAEKNGKKSGQIPGFIILISTAASPRNMYWRCSLILPVPSCMSAIGIILAWLTVMHAICA